VSADSSPPPSGSNTVAAILSRALWPSWTSGLALFLAVFLPQARGCSGQIEYPIEKARSADGFVQATMIIFPFAFGAILVLLIFWIALNRTRESIAIYHTVVCTIGGAVSFICLAYVLAIVDRSDMAYGLPVVLVLLWTLYRPIKNRDLRLCSTITQNWLLVLLAYDLFILNLFAKAWFLGFYVANTALLGGLIAAWILFVFAEHDLVDSKLPIRKLQVSLRQLLIVSCGIPIVLSYYGWLNYLETQSPSLPPTTESIAPVDTLDDQGLP
jgi:hypothetical protein